MFVFVRTGSVFVGTKSVFEGVKPAFEGFEMVRAQYSPPCSAEASVVAVLEGFPLWSP